MSPASHALAGGFLTIVPEKKMLDKRVVPDCYLKKSVFFKCVAVGKILPQKKQGEKQFASLNL